MEIKTEEKYEIEIGEFIFKISKKTLRGFVNVTYPIKDMRVPLADL